MKFFNAFILAFICFSVNSQTISSYKKVKSQFAFESPYKSNFKKARTSFSKNELNTDACLDNYGCISTVLAVFDLQFGAERKSENTVLLNWTTNLEINNFGFEIQRKNGKFDFEKIGFVYASEQKNTENKYEFADINDANETSYYRLKIIDTESKFTFSKIIAVISFDQSLALKIVSNPIIGDEIIFEIIGLETNEIVNLTIFDMFGRKINESNHNVLKSSNFIKLSKKGQFPLGRYFARANFKDKTLLNNFIIAQ
jgi:hypothetical protein